MEEQKKNNDVSVGQFVAYAESLRRRRNVKRSAFEKKVLRIHELMGGMNFSAQALSMTLQQMWQFEKMVCEGFLANHRINYAAMTAVYEMTDYLESKGLLKREVKFENSKIKAIFNSYKRTHKMGIKSESWIAFQDSMCIATDVLHDSEMALRDGIRDYLTLHCEEIGDTCKDVNVVVHAVFCMALLDVAKEWYGDYMKQAQEETGIDFTDYFQYANLQTAIPHLEKMCNRLGVGTFELPITDIPEWGQYMGQMCDNHLLDDACLQAFEFNPVVKANYEAIIAEENGEKNTVD